jgi:hypothetical protein
LRKQLDPNYLGCEALKEGSDVGLCPSDHKESLSVAKMFPKSLEPHFGALEITIAKDENFKASAKGANFSFGLRSDKSDEMLLSLSVVVKRSYRWPSPPL